MPVNLFFAEKVDIFSKAGSLKLEFAVLCIIVFKYYIKCEQDWSEFS